MTTGDKDGGWKPAGKKAKRPPVTFPGETKPTLKYAGGAAVMPATSAIMGRPGMARPATKLVNRLPVGPEPTSTTARPRSRSRGCAG